MKYAIALFALIISSGTQAQNFRNSFRQAFTEKDTVKQLTILKDWEKANANDPELYTSYFNYYFSKSRNDLLSLNENSNGKEGLELKDSEGKTPGYLNANTQYDARLTKKGLNYIDKGIAKFPDRLDMRFGKIYALGLLEDYEGFTSEIIAAIDHSNANKNAWKWTNDSQLPDAQEYMLSSIQSYQTQLYETENDALVDNMERIAAAILKYYPEDVRSLSNISVAYLIRKDYDRALEYLRKAEKINPKDPVVLGNIAQAYKLKGDDRNWNKYIELSRREQEAQKRK